MQRTVTDRCLRLQNIEVKKPMNSPQLMILAVAAMVLVTFVFVITWASRYVKVGPNQVLIVSGRKIQLPDGRCVGFRIIKGGGTFVFPVVEKVDVLSLEVIPVEMQKALVRMAKGQSAEVDFAAHVKVKGDDDSIVAAAEHLLSKDAAAIKEIVKPVLEKHLRTTLSGASFEEMDQTLDALSARVQAAASGDLGSMGLGTISFTIQNIRAG